MPNILVNKPCEARFFNPESRWDSTTCAPMARSLPYKQEATITLLRHITSGLQHHPGYARELYKRAIVVGGQIKTSSVVLAVTG